MPSLTNHHSSEFTKLLLIGDSGSGKTSSLASLVQAGYTLRVLDMDNGLDPLATEFARRGLDAGKVNFVTLRDKFRSSPSGPLIDGVPKAYVDAVRLLDHWKEGDNDLGRPSEWGANTVLVIDSLTFLSDAAFAWAHAMNLGAKDKRQIYGAAQDSIESVIAHLTSPNFKANAIVISHVKYLERPDGSTKGYPMSVGQALSTKIATYFNSVALCESSGIGKAERKSIKFQSTALIDLKSPVKFDLPALPIESALADFFKQARRS